MMNVSHVCGKCGQDLAALLCVAGLRRRLAYSRCFATMQLHLHQCGSSPILRREVE